MNVTDEIKTIRMLRYALAAIWTELEMDGDVDEMKANVQVIANEGLHLSGHFAKGYITAEDVADDSRGLESWRNHVSDSPPKIIKEFRG